VKSLPSGQVRAIGVEKGRLSARRGSFLISRTLAGTLLIVGGRIVGLTTAYFLARDGVEEDRGKKGDGS
jgi:hypothetical protein